MTEKNNFNLNLRNLFVNTAKNFSDTEIVYRDKRKYTYSKFFQRVNGLASGLREIGVKEGDTVAVIDWDTDKYLEAYYAVPMMGAVLHIVKGDKYEFPDLDENTTATIFYTSGTTGFPKGVTFTQRNLFMHTLALANGVQFAPMSVGRSDNFMILVPMFHVHSWGIPYMGLLNGNRYVLPGRYEVGMILELLKKENVKFSAMVPSILYMVLSAPNIEEYRDYLKGWRIIIGGAALPKGLAMKAKSLGITAIGAYGLSETAPLLTIAMYNDSVSKADEETKFNFSITTGIPVPMVTLRVVDQNMNDVPADSKTVGEIIVQTPWLTKGYFKDPQKTEELWKGGWLHTGDLAVKHPNGYISIVDREKDAVKSGGEFIPSLVLENAISEMKGVGEVAVVGKPHEKWGERPVAFIVKNENIKKEDVYAHLNKFVEVGRIQKWWIPDDIIFVDSIPKTSTGKSDKKELRKML